MKVVHYTTLLSRAGGGVPVAAAGLAVAMAGISTDVTIVGGEDEHLAEDRKVWGGLPIRTHVLKSGYGWDAKAFGMIADLKPDILHVHGIWTAGSIYGMAAALRGTPVIVSPHGMLDPWILGRKAAVKKVHSTLFERPMLRRGYVHALNASERDAATAFMPSLARRNFILPNGIVDIEVPQAIGPRSGVLYLGRLHEKKQVLELARAWSALPAHDGDGLTIAGWGDAAYEAEVRNLADASISYVGALYGEAKTAAFMGAKFFILPSLSEGLPMAVLEAIQHGCVPIITDQCNLPELFADDIALRMKADFSDFASVMIKALGMGEAEFAARSRAAQTYSRRYLWTNIAKAMVSEYEKILQAS